jgi:hypothetical protein
MLPGLVEYHFGRGIKGSRTEHYAAIWIYESIQAWEKLWGSPDKPVGKANYPKNWQVWEDEILAPLLNQDPDRINYTDYEEL